MKLRSVWNEKMRFTAEVDSHSVPMDTKPPIGDDTAITPKQMLVVAICGCTGTPTGISQKSSSEWIPS